MRSVSFGVLAALVLLGTGAAGCRRDDPGTDVPPSAKADAPLTAEQKAGMQSAADRARAFGEAKNREHGR